MPTTDKLMVLASKLARIDNRSDAMLAEEMDVCPQTVKNLREMNVEYVQSRTISKLLEAMHHVVVFRRNSNANNR